MEQKLFSDLEGLRIAMEMEVEGRDFYQQAYESVAKQEQKDLFLMLKNEEIHHYETFSKIYSKIKQNKEIESDDYLFDADSSRYLTILVEDYIFPKKDKAKAKIAEFKSMETILQAAIQAEKESILFYDALANESKFEEAKKIFIILKAEEQTHVVKLTEMLNAWA
ncbi:MAG TPA: ferritin family protein [Negativicutes bacterium]|jgi:rubrerythrin